MSQTLIGAQQLLNNEDFMQQFSPMIQGFLDNPEIIQSILTQSPQMQQLIQVCISNSSQYSIPRIYN